jgi:hypothetical protein
MPDKAGCPGKPVVRWQRTLPPQRQADIWLVAVQVQAFSRMIPLDCPDQGGLAYLARPIQNNHLTLEQSTFDCGLNRTKDMIRRIILN